MPSLFLLVLFFAAACGRPEPKDQDGKALFKALNCRACHKIGNEGASRGGPDLTMVGSHKSREWLDLFLSDPQAWKPRTLMPNPRLSPKTRGLIVDYLSSLKGQDWKEGRPWNRGDIVDPAMRGHVLYARAGCASCHGSAGRGGQPNNNVPGGLIPGLANVSQTFTKDELKKKIAAGATPQKADPSGPPPLIAMPAWGQTLSEEEISLVVEYLWSLTPAQAEASDW